MGVLVSIDSLSKSFGEKIILSNVTMELEVGKIYGILGRNGCGKTILLKCLAGLIKPESGVINIFGRQLGKDIDFAPNTGIAIEQNGFLLRKSGKENMRFLASLKCKPNIKRIDELLKNVGLNPYCRDPVECYSMGMKQRLRIATALLHQPQLLLLDNPLADLDESGINDMWSIFRNLAHNGAIVIFTIPFNTDIAELCDCLYRLEDGKLTTVDCNNCHGVT